MNLSKPALNVMAFFMSELCKSMFSPEPERRVISASPSVDASEHAAIIEVLGLRERQLLFQVANSLLTILEFTSLTIGEAGKTLRHENVNLLLKRIQKLNSGREYPYACHTQFLSETLWLKPFQPAWEGDSIPVIT
jgi:hypothetical protein